jgi:hypothetical protein
MNIIKYQRDSVRSTFYNWSMSVEIDQINGEIGMNTGPILLLFVEPLLRLRARHDRSSGTGRRPRPLMSMSCPCELYLRDPCHLNDKVRTCAPSSSLDSSGSGTSGSAGGGGQWLIATRCASTASPTSQQQYQSWTLVQGVHASLIGFI